MTETATETAAKTELVARQQTTAATATRPNRFTAEQIAAATISHDTMLPNIQQAQASNIPIQKDYWSPEAEGEFKRGWILGIDYEEVADMETGELKLLESVLFVEETPDGKKARFFNASKILVANVKGAINRGEVIPANILYPVQITYLGKKKNRSNAKLSGRWEILPLVVQG